MQFSLVVVMTLAVTQALAGPLSARLQPERVECFNQGTKSDRAPFVSAIDNWCGKIQGKVLKDGDAPLTNTFEFGDVDYFFTVKAINGCSFTIDGNCNRLLRLPVDQCNTGGENGKQGGVMTDPCGQWTADPGKDGNAF
ncbi:hypothetical protein PM082_022793 [Marasmius tenuissimus]|nr:hypothetical protein PM082_022793 [Marasmius tenuissimus]